MVKSGLYTILREPAAIVEPLYQKKQPQGGSVNRQHKVDKI